MAQYFSRTGARRRARDPRDALQGEPWRASTRVKAPT
jgi:hypothetical protein